ncbi:hypothetical protein [Amycolatopsis sp. NBC_01480]|uniref:hypothetical protein n=1 Tax=Amycolatopsis sp. NBC_01480 TaxID=2903562 RepID=UPI002E2E36B2|nr:hypothetical protein [Amycolatopsis sp. NBC_01480]
MTISTESNSSSIKRKLLPTLGKGAAVLAAATLGFGIVAGPASAAPAAPAYPDCGGTFDHGYLGGPPDNDDNFGVRIEYHNVGAWIGSQVGDAVVTSAAGRSHVYSVDPNGTYFVADFNLGETGMATLALFRGDGPHVCSTSFAIGVVG